MVLKILTYFLLGESVLFSILTNAQTLPDTTLPHNSLVTSKQGNVLKPAASLRYQIDGGTRAGSNLFHSFAQFNVPTGGTAFFNNALDVQNIFSRVTGSTVSSIDGILKANGTASLFLMNPNGIIFGKNAQLNIGGSFLGTTANAIKFADGTQFSAIGPTLAPLLTVSVPVGLGFGSNPGSIIVQGDGERIDTSMASPVGLSIKPSQTIALIGGDLIFSGGILTTQGGRIELGSVGSGTVTILNNKGLSFDYKNVKVLGNIILNGQSLVDASGNGGGYIQIYSNRLAINDGSQISIYTFGNTNNGKISIFATDSLELVGSSVDNLAPSGIFIGIQPGATGDAANLDIKAGHLLVKDGATISSSTFGNGSAGKINLDSDSAIVSGTSVRGFPSSITVASQPGSTGNGGNLILNTNKLIINGGGVISSGTFGSGNGGNLLIKSSDLVDVSGIPQLNGNHLVFGANKPSRISSRSIGNGNAGSLIIETKNLNIYDGATITVMSTGTGNAGILNFNASSINLNNQGNITAATSLSTGGNINVNTRSIQLRNNSKITGV